MRIFVLFVSVCTSLFFVVTHANAAPKFAGHCLNDAGVKALFKKYPDVEQLGPWNSEEIQARKHGKGAIRASRRIALTGIPSDKVVIATVCGSLPETQQNATAQDDSEKQFYPHGKPGHWCGYGGPGFRMAVSIGDARDGPYYTQVNGEGMCVDFSPSWFQGYTGGPPSIEFVNGAETYLRGYVWAYVRAANKSD
jgi:hypothetical protein